ncbi:hypothetical protein SDC9_07785 [bioreactor metagenome]|uniref:Capsule synthesis protein CapA domain-containing protein n=1 Tax=bioreactor metagenome TaxID=1076179 RepID=A0A644T8E5_9ZZZZ|nr:CapA family protein [Candidatus Elulimicrobiales bacterium]
MKEKSLFIIFLIIILGVFGYLAFNKKFTREYTISNIDNQKENLTQPKKSELDILFVGDIMLDRFIRKRVNENGSAENFVNNFLGNFREHNKNYDYIVANLEGPITENKTKTLNADGSYNPILLFTFPTSTPQILNLLNVKVVSLANNHTDNFYNQGFQETKIYLEKGNIKYFSNPYNDNQIESLSNTICEKEICIAYIGYHEFTKDNDSERIENEILKLKQDKKVDFVIVVPHWGTEYRKTSNQNQKYLAHKWIDAGADMIIGGHPHVIEESEIYKDKYIYYSLGNYIFDQWFDEDVKKGLGVNFKFKKEISEAGEIKKEIELVKEIKTQTEKTGIKYLLE